LALRWVVRCAETNLLSQHWRGTPERRTAYAQFSGLLDQRQAGSRHIGHIGGPPATAKGAAAWNPCRS
jgi:hypothetical protein